MSNTDEINDIDEQELLDLIETAINDSSNDNFLKAKKAIIKLGDMCDYGIVPFDDVFHLAAIKGNKEIVECLFSVINDLKSGEDEVYDEDLNYVFENIPYAGCIHALENCHFEISDFINDNWEDYQTVNLIEKAFERHIGDIKPINFDKLYEYIDKSQPFKGKDGLTHLFQTASRTGNIEMVRYLRSTGTKLRFKVSGSKEITTFSLSE